MDSIATSLGQGGLKASEGMGEKCKRAPDKEKDTSGCRMVDRRSMMRGCSPTMQSGTKRKEMRKRHDRQNVK